MKRRNRPEKSRKGTAPSPAVDRIYGVHAARAALANPERVIRAVYTTQNALSRVSDLLENTGIMPIEMSPFRLSGQLGGDTVHQGVLVEAEPLKAPGLDDVVQDATHGKPLILLDQVTDPHNAGAILRSAAAFNASAVIMTRRNSPPLDGVLAKAASGAVEHVPILLIANLARTLRELGDQGVLRIGLDGGADQPLETAEIAYPIALVLGAEHKGLRRLTAENCDFLCRLTTTGPLASLNVSNAAAVALHSLAVRTR